MSGSSQVYIKGFSHDAQEDDLRQAFKDFGDIRQVRMIKDYAFIVYSTNEQADEAVKQMHGKFLMDYKLKVQRAGHQKKPRGPQPNDQCRYCGKTGHWKNDCPSYRNEKRRRRRSSSSDSSSSSSQSRRRHKRRKEKKIKKHKKRSPSSSSSSSVSSSDHSRDKKKRSNA